MSKQTITEFLKARIAEDDAYAYDVAGEREGDRVLAECAAKRAIINLADEALRAQADRRDASALGAELMHDDVLCALAAVYASHPAYRQEWAL